MKINWNFPRGARRVQNKKPSVRGVWIFCETSHSIYCLQEVRQGRRAAQNVQSNQDPDEDVLDATLGDMSLEPDNNNAAATEHDQV